MTKRVVMVPILKPLFSALPEVRELEEKDWKEFERWIEDKGGCLGKSEKSGFGDYGKERYEITFSPVIK